MIIAVLLDMDNTLIATQDLFEEAHDRLTAFIESRTKTPPAESVATVRRFEVELFAHFGYGTGMLPQAFENALLKYAPQSSDADIAAVRGMASDVYTRAAHVIPGVPQALESMAQHFDLYILTAGEPGAQQRRIDALPFRHLFKGTFPVPEKTPETYLTLLKKLGLQPHEVVMIGDSLKSDIIPSVAAGLSAIHIPHANWVGREMAGLKMPESTLAAVFNHMSGAAASLISGAVRPSAVAPPLPQKPAAPARAA
ncbi:MAG: HAD family hydrolase [bacterium]|nr:HAD family hydrolase [bacterium]